MRYTLTFNECRADKRFNSAKSAKIWARNNASSNLPMTLVDSAGNVLWRNWAAKLESSWDFVQA